MSHTDPQTQTFTNGPQPSQQPVINVNNPPANPDRYFTADDLEKARQQEKDKLYKSQESLKKNFDTLQAEVTRLNDEREAREASDKKRQDEVTAAKKAADEAELSAKEILARRENEWNAQAAELKEQMAQQNALFAKEREFQELRAYIVQQAEAHREEIVPELVDLISGNTREEVDQSIAKVIEKSHAILEGVNRMQSAQRAGQQGVSTTGFTPNGPVDGVPGQQRPYTDAELQAMGMEEYAKVREQIGLSGNNDYSMSKLWG